MYFLGIDLGTTGCKSALFKDDGEIAAEAYVEYPLIYKDGGFIEQDADLWWILVKKVISDTMKKAAVPPAEINAMSVSSQGIAFVPVGADGNVICNAFSWLDMRAIEEIGLIETRFGERHIFEKTGKRINPAYSLPKMMWLKTHHPEIYARTWKFMMGLDFITYRLTGQVITDHSMAGGTMAYNIVERRWDKEILDICGIDIEKLPKIMTLGSLIGTVSTDAAEETGLSETTHVILGAQDQKCAAIGAGIADGICTVSLGTSTAMETISRIPPLDPEMRIPCFALDDGRWVLEAVLATSGASLKWMRDNLFPDRSYGQLDDMVEKASPGSDGVYFYPHLEGAASPYWSAGTKGFIYGLGLNTSAGDMIRSLYEGVAFQIRLNLDVLERLGPEVNEIRLFGGGAKSEVWCRIIADVTGKFITTLQSHEMAVFGAAVIAGKYSGEMQNARQISNTYRPDAEACSRYDEVFEEYIGIQGKLI